MKKSKTISNRILHKKQLRELRIKKLEQKMKSNIQKRKQTKKING